MATWVRRTRSVLVAVAVTALTLGTAAGTAGAADVPFSPTPRMMWSVGPGEVRAVLTVGNVLYVGGNFAKLVPPSGGGAVARFDVAALDLTSGLPVTSFTADTDGSVRGLASDGTRLFITGKFTTVNGVARTNFAAVDLTTGAVDPLRLDLSDTGYALHVRGTSLYVAGKFNQIGGKARRKLAKVDLTTGAVDMAFNPRPDKAVWSIDMPASGSVLWAGGEFLAFNGVARAYAAGVDPATGVLTGPVFATSGYMIDVDVSDDGSRLYTAGGDSDNSARAWDTASGAQVWRRQVGGNVQAVHVSGSFVYIGFHDNYNGNTLRKMLALDVATGVPDPWFQPDISVFLGVWDITSTPTALVAGGVFADVNLVNARRVAVFPTLGPSTTVVDGTTSWRYLDTGVDQGTAWTQPGFDDATWKAGRTQLGYGDGDEATVVSYGPSASAKYPTTYGRATFTLSAVPTTATLSLVVDDGAVAYVNGVEIGRYNLPVGPIAYGTWASAAREDTTVVLNIPVTLLVAGTNTLAVEVHQAGPTSSDVSLGATLVVR